MKYFVVGIILLFSACSNASLIESTNYSNNSENIYWTNIDLGLEVIRLDWADTLGSTEQAGVSDFEAFIAETKDNWRFATWNEFINIVNWFDTDPTSNGWSVSQNVGGNLFFELNGFGPDHTDQYGFDHEGYTYWQFGTFNIDSILEFAWFADFGDQDNRVVCVEWSVLCSNSYFPDANTPMFTAASAISMGGINVAPVLVRNVSETVTSSIVNVSEPSAIVILISGLLFVAVRKKKSK